MKNKRIIALFTVAALSLSSTITAMAGNMPKVNTTTGQERDLELRDIVFNNYSFLTEEIESINLKYALVPKGDSFWITKGDSGMEADHDMIIQWVCHPVRYESGGVNMNFADFGASWLHEEKFVLGKEYKFYDDNIKEQINRIRRDFEDEEYWGEKIDWQDDWNDATEPFIMIRVVDNDLGYYWYWIWQLTDEPSVTSTSQAANTTDTSSTAGTSTPSTNTSGLSDDSAFYTYWASNEIGWWVQCSDGTYLVNQWYQSPESGLWYYLGIDGYMLTNAMAPDGYLVDANGVWMQ